MEKKYLYSKSHLKTLFTFLIIALCVSLNPFTLSSLVPKSTELQSTSTSEKSPSAIAKETKDEDLKNQIKRKKLELLEYQRQEEEKKYEKTKKEESEKKAKEDKEREEREEYEKTTRGKIHKGFKDMWDPIQKRLPDSEKFKNFGKGLAAVVGAGIGGLVLYKGITDLTEDSSGSGDYARYQPSEFFQEEDQPEKDEYGASLTTSSQAAIEKGVILATEGSIIPPFLITLTPYDPKNTKKTIRDHKVTLVREYHITPNQPQPESLAKQIDSKLPLESYVNNYKKIEQRQQELLIELNTAQNQEEIKNIKEKFFDLEQAQKEILEKASMLYPESQPSIANTEKQLVDAFTKAVAQKTSQPISTLQATNTTPAPTTSTTQPTQPIPQAPPLPPQKSIASTPQAQQKQPKTQALTIKELMQQEEVRLGRDLSTAEIIKLYQTKGSL